MHQRTGMNLIFIQILRLVTYSFMELPSPLVPTRPFRLPFSPNLATPAPQTAAFRTLCRTAFERSSIDPLASLIPQVRGKRANGLWQEASRCSGTGARTLVLLQNLHCLQSLR